MAIIRILIHVIQQSLRNYYITKNILTPSNMPKNNMKNHDQNSMQNNQNNNMRIQEEELQQIIQPFIHDINKIQSHHHSLSIPTLQATLPSSTQQYNQQNITIQQLCSQLDKIIINCVVWQKAVNGLFDYEQQKRIVKSSILIDENLTEFINVNLQKNNCSELVMNQKTKLILIYKNKQNELIEVKKLVEQIELSDIDMKTNNIKIIISGEDTKEKEFLCGLELVFAEFTKKVYVKLHSKDDIYLLIKENVSQQTQEIDQNETFNQQLMQNTKPKRKLNNKPYFIVRSLITKKNIDCKGFKLQLGDLIKLGKVQYKVSSIDGQSYNQFEQLNHYKNTQKILDVSEIDQQTLNEIECKYCLGSGKVEHNNSHSSEGMIDNFFLHLCACKGNIGYVHYECLTKWTTTKATSQSFGCIKMYLLQKMKCQVCLQDFPQYFRYNQKIYNLLPIELPEKHLVLINVPHGSNISSNNENMIITVINGESDREITIGRGRSSLLRINDITVSRQHAVIQRIGQDYYIKDSKSKFGTIVRPSNDTLRIELQKKKGFQINNCIFTVQIITKEERRIKQSKNVVIESMTERISEQQYRPHQKIIVAEQQSSPQNHYPTEKKPNNIEQDENTHIRKSQKMKRTN